MNAYRVRRKCEIRGCKNTTDVFSFTKTKEHGNSVIVCMECAKRMAIAVEKIKPVVKEPYKAPTPLFFNEAANLEKVELTNDEKAFNAFGEPINAEGKFVCEHCGQKFTVKVALAGHQRGCKAKEPPPPADEV